MPINLSPKWLATTLALSLCLNLAAVGFFIGRVSRGHDHEILVNPQTVALQALPEDRVRELVRDLSESIPPMHQDMTQLRRVRGELHHLLMAEPFNHVAFATKLDELTAGVARVHGQTNTSFVKITMHLTPNERRMVANMIERPTLLRAPMQVWIERNINKRFDAAQPTQSELRLAAVRKDPRSP